MKNNLDEKINNLQSLRKEDILRYQLEVEQKKNLLKELKNTTNAEKIVSIHNEIQKIEQNNIALIIIDGLDAYIFSLIKTHAPWIQYGSDAFDAMYSEIVAAIIRVIPKWDPEHSKAITFFTPTIQDEIRKVASANSNFSSAYYYRNAYAVSKMIDEMRAEGYEEKDITPQTISRKYDIGIRKITSALAEMKAVQAVNLDDVENMYSLSASPEEQYLENEKMYHYAEQLECLSDIERCVFLKKFGITSGLDRTYKEISIDPELLKLVSRLNPDLIRPIPEGGLKIKHRIYFGVYIPETTIRSLINSARIKLKNQMSGNLSNQIKKIYGDDKLLDISEVRIQQQIDTQELEVDLELLLEMDTIDD